MDDASRKERLSAARKKLREYQHKKKGPSGSPNPDKSPSPEVSPKPPTADVSPPPPPPSGQDFNANPQPPSSLQAETFQGIQPPLPSADNYSALPTASALFSASSGEQTGLANNGSVFDAFDPSPVNSFGENFGQVQQTESTAQSYVQSFRRVSPSEEVAPMTPPAGPSSVESVVFGRNDSKAEAEISAHASTIRLLVNERSELETLLNATRSQLHLQNAETEEALNTLSWYKNRVNELENEVDHLKRDFSQQSNQLMSLSNAAEAKVKLGRMIEEQQTEIAELARRLNEKLGELDEARRHGQEMEAKLKLAELRLASSETAGAAWWEAEKEKLLAEKATLEAEVVKRGLEAKTAAEEEWTSVVEEWQRKSDETSKELSLAQERVTQLEKQLEEAEEARRRKEEEDEENKRQEEEKKLESAEEGAAPVIGPCSHGDYEALVGELGRLRTLVSGLEMELQDSRRLVADSQQVAASAASDQLAASRALAQNRAMKKQLDELQDAFIKMSHSKMEAAEEAAAEKHKNAEVCAKVREMEEEVRGLRAELISTAGDLEAARKELMSKEGIEDRLQHYHVEHRGLSQGLELQLAEAKTSIEELRQERNELKEEIANMRNKAIMNGTLEAEASSTSSSVEALSSKLLEVETEKAVLADKLAKVQQQGNKEELVQGLSHELQTKFAKLMDDYARVSDEKQQLEHLCMQLQGETDTIGEYVALYRVQRSILLRQAEEKEAELHRLNKERENMRNKLTELESLVVKQLKRQKRPTINGEVAEIHNQGDDNHDHGHEEVESKIMAVLSEVKESDLIANQTLQSCYNEAFHPCVCCSGKLITV